MNNRQLRVWVFMLYPDNPKHCAAIDYIDLLDNAVYIQHVAKTDVEGHLINKAHWHVVMKFDPSIWLSKLLKDLSLDEEDAHLFHSYTDFKIGKKQNKLLSLLPPFFNKTLPMNIFRTTSTYRKFTILFI